MSALKRRLPTKVERKVSSAIFVLVALSVPLLGYAYGGYYVADWGIAAAAFAALVLAGALFGVLGGARSVWSVVAMGFFILYTAWSFLSMLWSANRADAWSGSDVTLLYLLVFWVSATLVALNASRRWVLSVLAIGPGAVALLTVPMLAPDANAMFEGDRLLGTVGYFNAEAAFLLVSFWVSLYVAGSRRVHPALRIAALAGAVAGVEIATLTQSRGAMVALLVSLPVFFLFSGQRLRGAIALLPVACALAVSFPRLNDVYLQMAASGGSGPQAIDQAVPLIWGTVAGAAFYGLAWALVDRRWRPSQTFVRVAGISAVVCTVALISIGAVYFAEHEGNPATWAKERWIAFKTNDLSGQRDSRYLSASGSGRFVLWQVAWQDFTEHPLLGVGTQNYEATYYQKRKEVVGWVHQPHSLPLEILAERGAVGGILFAGFFGTCFAAGVWKRFTSLNAEGKAQVGAMLAAVTYWFVHSSAEWFWQIPAVTIPAVIYLSLLAAPYSSPRDDEPAFAPSDRPLRLAGIGLAALTFLTVGPLFIANYYANEARNTHNPWESLAKVERARRFDPLDPDLARLEGDFAFKIGNFPLATQSYARAIDLNPENYANYAVLAAVYEQLGQPEKALRLYTQALKLNPLDKSLQQSVARVERQASRS